MKGRSALALTAAALAAALGFFLQRERLIAGSVGLSGFPLGDSWILFQFANDVAEARGFAYNAGVPMSGSTAPPRWWCTRQPGTAGGPALRPVLCRPSRAILAVS